MTTFAPGTVAVIFVAQRTDEDEVDYQAAAEKMAQLASKQDGYVGVDSVRDAGGLGITVSYWRDDAAAKAWRDNPEHAVIREEGRRNWYGDYSLHVAEVTRSYDWTKS